MLGLCAHARAGMTAAARKRTRTPANVRAQVTPWTPVFFVVFIVAVGVCTAGAAEQRDAKVTGHIAS